MRFGKRLLFALLVSLLASPLFAQIGTPGITNPPPTFTGGTITSPILGASACTAPPFSFTSDSDAGLCLAATNSVRIQTGTTALTDRVQIGGSAAVAGSPSASINVFDSANVSASFRSGVTASAGFMDWTSGGATRYTWTASRHFTNFVTTNAQIPYFNLNTSLASNTFLSFTNVATPASVIAFTQDTDLSPTLVVSASDAGGESRLTQMAGTASLSANALPADGRLDLQGPGGTPSASISATDGTETATVAVQVTGGAPQAQLTAKDSSLEVQATVVQYLADNGAGDTVTHVAEISGGDPAISTTLSDSTVIVTHESYIAGGDPTTTTTLNNGAGSSSNSSHTLSYFQRLIDPTGAVNATYSEEGQAHNITFGSTNGAVSIVRFGAVKDIPDNAATGFMSINVASNGEEVGSGFHSGGTIHYRYRTTSGSETQGETGIVTWSGTWSGGGSDVCDIDKGTFSQAVSAGTLAVTFACAVSGAGVVTLQVTADTSFNNTGTMYFGGESLGAFSPSYP